jgi:hypothetical protein
MLGFWRAVKWVWRRLGDIQTFQWIWDNFSWKSGISAVVSAITTWLGAGRLRGWQLVLLAIATFLGTMATLTLFEAWRYWRAENKLNPWARLARIDRETRHRDLPPPPPGNRPEHIRRDLDGLIREGEDLVQRRLSITAAPLFQRVVPEGIWSATVIEWRGRSITYLKQARLDSDRFVDCSSPEAKTLTIDQVRCHVERLRESL